MKVAENLGCSSEKGQALFPNGLETKTSSPTQNPQTGFAFIARRSLAWRLTTTYLLTTLFIVLILSLAVYFATTFYIEGRLEAELTAQADFYAAYAANLAPDERTLAGLAPTLVGLFAPQADLNVRLFAASNGALLAATQDIGPQPSQAALMALGYRSPTLFTQPSRDLPHRRYAARAVMVGVQPAQRTIGVVEVSRSTLSSEQFLTTLRRILLGTLLVALALTLVVSVLMAHRLVRPIRDMEAATQRIATGDLEVRLGDYPPDEIGRLADSINHMAERLQYLEAARARFISEIAHELRTPLTAIKGLLINLIDTARPGERSSLEIAEGETDRLIRLVNQLLDFSRWRAGRLELHRQPVDVGSVARTAATLTEARARHRGVALKAEIQPGLPVVSADSDRLQQAILNLLDNAIKFTPRRGQVTLSVIHRQVTLETQEEIGLPKGHVELGVQDTGRGMSSEERERAFEPYYRGGAAPAARVAQRGRPRSERDEEQAGPGGGGSGLGLTIARAIVEAHGGQIGIESSPGQGSRVWFRLPL
jgi:signal transduction histidine kinase